MMASVRPQAINCLQLNRQNSLVVGVIVTSLNTKTFQLKSKYRVGTRNVWTFTLRDSEYDTINVTVWGNEDYVHNLHTTFSIGFVVDVINSKIQSRPIDEKNERFSPSTSSPYILTVNEGDSLIQCHDGPDKALYKSLLQIPMKCISNLKSLANIVGNIETLQNQYVDILAVVTLVSDSRNIMTKDGRLMICRDFGIHDGTTQETIALKLWENEWIRRSAFWEMKKTVLFLSDVFITADNFKKKITMMIVRKTLITEDPNVPQANELRLLIGQIDPDLTLSNTFILPKPDCITTIMTIKEITEKLNSKKTIFNDTERVQFVTILYATITEINMEDTKFDILITRCAVCKRVVATGQDSCMNLECPCGNGKREPVNTHNFYLKVNLKDDTGYLIGCRLTGSAAERALDCTVDQFKEMTQTQRIELKWKLTLENCESRVQILGPSLTFPRALYNILSLTLVREHNNQ